MRQTHSIIIIALTTTALAQTQTLPPPHQSHPSSSWWNRLVESENDIEALGVPVNRRSCSATVYRLEEALFNAAELQNNGDETDYNTNESATHDSVDEVSVSEGGANKNNLVTKEGIREWMIITGGFTDQDWNTFPVWAFDMTYARSVDDGVTNEATDQEVSHADSNNDEESRSPWTDLTGLNIGSSLSTLDELEENSYTRNNTSGPQGRVGHLSSIYNDCLYIFGGLTYTLGSFHVENDNGDSDDVNSSNDGGGSEKNTMIVWKACGLQDLFTGKTTNAKMIDEDKMGLLKWERIVPTVNTSFPIPPRLKDEENKIDNHRSAATSTSQDQSTTTQQEPIMLSRGEAQGGHYAPGNCFILYGGMHRHRTSVLENGANAPSTNNEVPLGDVWKYDYETETFSLLASYPPLDWQRDYTNTKTFPTARTSHAGTISGTKLIIHGGMGSYGDERNTDTSSLSPSDHSDSYSSSSSYATYKTSPKWIPLADTWEFDLLTLQWKERVQYPQLARSYHSLVGWPADGRIAAFGGFQQDNNIGGETVAFVFKDVIVSRANETHWWKVQSPYNQIANWRKYHYNMPRMGISNRLEHSAVLDQYGSMYVWGGRFQSVHQIAGMWRLDVFNSDANLEYELAQPDGIEQYEAELEALHMFIAMMMFVSLTLSSFFSMMQQRQAREAAEEGGGGGSIMLPRRGGLTRRVIDSLPLKHYEVAGTSESDVSTENQSLEQSECCPICLVEYEQGCELRSLPCGHDFCRVCIDPWLEEHTSCPACRQRVETVSPNAAPSSWASSIGRMYTPNRRNAGFTFRPRLQPLGSPLSTESNDNSSQTDSNTVTSEGSATPRGDEWYDQGSSSGRFWFGPFRRYFRAENATHAAVPNDETAETLELV